MINVLVFPCGSEIALEILRSLKDQKNVNLFGASSIEDSGRFMFENYIGNLPLYNEPNFIEEIKSIVDNHKIHAIFPCLDICMPILKSNEIYLGCKIITSPLETVEICVSKRKTYGLLNKIINTPKEFKADEIEKYPVFLKPVIGSSSRFTYLVKDKNELDFYLSQRRDLMILEYLPGKEFTVDCFTNFKGDLLYVSPRERKRIINGISVESKLIKDPKIVSIAKKINSELKFDGAWFFQIKIDSKGEYSRLEIASRFGGSSLLQRFLGVNLPMLSLLNIFNIETEIQINDFEVEISRNLDVRFKSDLNFSNVFVDWDDTIIVKGKINVDLIMDALITLKKVDNFVQSEIEPFNIMPVVDKGVMVLSSAAIANLIRINTADLNQKMPPMKIPLTINNEFKMDKVDFIIVDEVEHAIIEHADGSFTSMLKSTYDAMQAAQSTPSIPEGGN
jgi:hypothetical protein